MPLKMIPARSIERIEIVAVPGAEYGDAGKNGVINVVLKKELNEGVKVMLNLDDTQEYYNSQSGGVLLSYSSKKVNILSSVSGNHNQSHLGLETAYRLSDESRACDIAMANNAHGGGLKANFNLEYAPTDKATWGFRVATSATKNTRTESSDTRYYSAASDESDAAARTTVTTTTPFKPNVTANLSYDLKADAQRGKLGINLYYGYFDSRNDMRGVDKQTLPQPAAVENDYIQYNTGTTNYGGAKAEYTEKFDEDNTLKTGLYLYYYTMDNGLAYVQRTGTKFGSEREANNSQRYRDLTSALYASYDRTWSDKVETSLGVRGEYYWADGRERKTNDCVDRSQFVVLPFVSLLYMPHDDHEFSLDIASSIDRLPLRKLNSFKYYSSANEYHQENPNLTSSPDFDMMFSYDFFGDYSFAVDYLYMPDCWTDFTVPDGEGNIVSTTANYGDSHGIDLSFTVQKRLFQNRWWMNAYLGANYSSDKGSYKEIVIDNRSWRASFRMNNTVFLSKDQNWLLELTYKYSSETKGPSITIPSTHSLDIGL